MIIGVPNPHCGSPYVILKMQYLDEIGQSGRKWYESEGSLATNQAIGRGIRHKDDFAVVLLFDSRFYKHDQILMRPKWVQNSYVSLSPKFIMVLQNFYLKPAFQPPDKKSIEREDINSSKEVVLR